MERDLLAKIRNVKDFPKQGIVFRDITTLLKDPDAFGNVVQVLSEKYKGDGVAKVVGIESRGFIFGAALAFKLNAGFVPIRKSGKLPAEKLRQEYMLEYGRDAMEVHTDAINKGDRVLVHDDLLATGGTVSAACQLVERLGGTIVGVSFIVELTYLKGREQLGGYDVYSILKYEKE